MEEKPPDRVGDEAVIWATREFIKDSDREIPRADDSPAQRAARKYLKSRSSRIRIQQESRSRIDAFPRRLIEIMRAHKLAKIGEFSFESKEDREHWLPTYARTLVDHSPSLPERK